MHWQKPFRSAIAFVCAFFWAGLASAQIGQYDIYKDREIGAEPPVIQAVLDQDIAELKKLWISSPQLYRELGSKQRSALIYASMTNKTQSMDFLIEKGALINAIDDVGNTALHYAAAQGYQEACAKLLDARIDMNFANNNGEVALFIAVRYGHWDVIALLLDAGADTDVTDYTARGLMDYARESKDRKILHKLRKRVF